MEKANWEFNENKLNQMLSVKLTAGILFTNVGIVAMVFNLNIMKPSDFFFLNLSMQEAIS